MLYVVEAEIRIQDQEDTSCNELGYKRDPSRICNKMDCCLDVKQSLIQFTF